MAYFYFLVAQLNSIRFVRAQLGVLLLIGKRILHILYNSVTFLVTQPPKNVTKWCQTLKATLTCQMQKHLVRGTV